MKLYFQTHATTTDNEAQIASGWRDIGLSDGGVQPAKERSTLLKGIHLDLVCTSDLKRAVDTTRLAFGDSLPVIIDKRLRELNYEDWNGKPSGDVEKLMALHATTPFPNGESSEQAVHCVHEFVRDLTQKHPGKSALIVGHRATQYGLETLHDVVHSPYKWQPYWEYSL